MNTVMNMATAMDIIAWSLSSIPKRASIVACLVLGLVAPVACTLDHPLDAVGGSGGGGSRGGPG
jgi:hypothetical protein